MALRSMRARVTGAMVAVTVGALFLTGVVTLAYTVRSARTTTLRQLEREAAALALNFQDRAGIRASQVGQLLQALAGPLRLEGVAVIGWSPSGVPYPLGDRSAALSLPSGLTSSELHLATLESGATVAGGRGATLFAASPFSFNVASAGRVTTLHGAVVITRTESSGAGGALPWLLASSLGVVVLAIAVADWMSRRIVRPLRAAEDATARIAAGDLAARVDLPPDADGELAALAASINAMGGELTRARQAQRQYFLSVSHDLRTPLSAIRGYAEALEDGAVDAARAAAVISSETRRLERLVRDVLELGRIELRQFSLLPEPTDLGAAVEAAVAAFAPTADELALSLRSAGAGEEWVRADPDRVAQIVANLVENALNYAASTVQVGCAGARVWVEDDGPGISAEAQRKVFQPFVTADGSRPRRVGTGIGLAIVSELVDAMHGRIEVTSPTGPAGGTRMTVTLPPAPAPARP